MNRLPAMPLGVAVLPEDEGQMILQPRAVAERPILHQIITVLRRRKWLILGIVAVAVLVAVVVTLLMTPQYRASATLEIQRETGSFINIQGAEPKAAMVDQEFYETQYGLLRSETLAQRVATSLRLPDNQQFFEAFNVDISRFANQREERARVAAAILLGRIAIEPRRLSRLVDISFTSPDPALSQRVVNAWSEQFVQVTLQRRFDANSYARTFLEQRLAQLRQRIDESERQLVDYAASQGIVNLPSMPSGGQGGGTPERSLAADRLAALNLELSQATADRVRAESQTRLTSGALPAGLQNPAVATLRQRRAEIAAQYAQMMTTFGPEYPPAAALRAQRDELDSAISREEGQARSVLQQTASAAIAREASIRQQVDQFTAQVLDLRRRSIQYNIIQREADTNRQLYDALLQRYKEIGVAGGVGANNIAVVDSAELPGGPSSPKLLINIAIGLLLGLSGGIGLAFLLDRLDQGVREPSAVEEKLGLPLIGTLPRIKTDDPLLELRDLKSELSESYTSLQTALSFATEHGVPRSLAVTSTKPAEGKSTTSYALARSLSRLGRKVMLVDGDMRSPSLHHFVGATNRAGLSNYLSGDDNWRALTVNDPNSEGLLVMAAGPQPPSAAELLSSGRIAQLIEVLGTDFDHIVFDAPPVMGLADAPLIASNVEGTLFVIEANGTQATMARVAIERLAAAQANLVGAVLSKFDASRASYGYDYGYGYGYGYGKKQAEGA